jgi:hypothetical protein
MFKQEAGWLLAWSPLGSLLEGERCIKYSNNYNMGNEFIKDDG